MAKIDLKCQIFCTKVPKMSNFFAQIYPKNWPILIFSTFKLAIEAITNIRTVAGLGREKTFVQKYVQELEGPHNKAKKKSHIRGLVFGFAQSMPFYAYAGCMYYGGYLVDQKSLEYQNVYK